LDAALASLKRGEGNFSNALVLIINSAAQDDPQKFWPPFVEGSYPNWAAHASMISQILNHKNIEESVFHNLWITLSIILLALFWLMFGEYRLSQKWRRPVLALVILNGIFLFVAFLALLAGQRMWIVIPALVLNSTYLIVRRSYHQYRKVPIYTDFEILISHSQNGVYPVAVTAGPTGEVGTAFGSFLNDPMLQDTMRKLKALSANKSDFSWLGAKLFESIFSDKIHLLYERALGQIEMQQSRLRLKLRIDPPELAVLPWEFFYDARLRHAFLALSERISIVRHLPTPEHHDKEELQLPLKILVVISSPHGLRPLDVEKEKADLKRALRNLRLTHDVKLIFTKKATLPEIEQKLKTGIHILHYIGHGEFDTDLRHDVPLTRHLVASSIDGHKLQTWSGEGILALEDEYGSLHRVDAQTFGELLRGSSVRLVVLNSCEGAVTSEDNAFLGVAHSLIAAGIPATVAMQFEIPDDVAIVFARAFYTAFIQHSYSVDAAVAAARRAIMSHSTLSSQHWATPELFMHNTDGSIFR
jgi:hypothetical protein